VEEKELEAIERGEFKRGDYRRKIKE